MNVDLPVTLMKSTFVRAVMAVNVREWISVMAEARDCCWVGERGTAWKIWYIGIVAVVIFFCSEKKTISYCGLDLSWLMLL